MKKQKIIAENKQKALERNKKTFHHDEWKIVWVEDNGIAHTKLVSLEEYSRMNKGEEEGNAHDIL